MSPSRRTFLTQLSAAAAAGFVGSMPLRLLWAARPVDLLPEPDEALLRELALKAMDVARGAGASFADIRIGAGRGLVLRGICFGNGSPSPNVAKGQPTALPVELYFSVNYGVRAIVDGAWGSAIGTELTTGAVTQVARTAVAAARVNRPRHTRTLELAPAPRDADGTWTTPIAQDPFAVPIKEQLEVMLAALAEAAKLRELATVDAMFQWRRPTFVFASTDGSLLVQRLALAYPGTLIAAGNGTGSFAWGKIENLLVGGYGYEALGDPTSLGSRMRQAAERTASLARAAGRPTSVEVGRYDLVFSSEVMANLLASTVGRAVDLELALGYRANRQGTSFAAPPADILGRYQVGAKLLTVQADRSRPHGGATVGWDDEGVKPDDYTFIKEGVIVDYHTSRETAVQLADWYRQRGEPVRSHGCARSTDSIQPVVRIPNLTLQPGPGTISVEDLIADTKRGFYIEETEDVWPDHQIFSAQVAVVPTHVRQIANGKLGGYVKDLAFQFHTPQFWKSVEALGGAGSARPVAVITDPQVISAGAISPFPFSTVQAVPARIRQVNVLNTGRTS